MELQSVVEKRPTKAEKNKRKSRKLKVIDKILSEDISFTASNSNDNFADDSLSRDSVINQMRPNSQVVETTCDTCFSNDNTNLAEDSSAYHADNTANSVTSRRVSFAIKKCSSKKRSKKRTSRKRRLQSIVLQALGDSFTRDLEIPEGSVTVQQQTAIPEHKLTQSVTETKAEATDTFRISKSKMRSVIKEKIVSVESAFSSNETNSSDAPSTSEAKEVETFPLRLVKQNVKHVLVRDSWAQTDSADSSAGNACVDVSVQAELCECPKLVGFHSATNVSTILEENLPKSAEDFSNSCKSLISVNCGRKVGDSKRTVPYSADLFEAGETVVPYSRHITSSDVEVNVNHACSVDDVSSDTSSRMFLRIGLSDDSRNLPDKSNMRLKINSVDDTLVCAVDEHNLDYSDSVNTADDLVNHKEKTKSKALDRSESAEDTMSAECMNISLQVSLASDGIPDENLVEEIATAASDDLLSLPNAPDDLVYLSNESAATNESDETFIYDVPHLKAAKESLMHDTLGRSKSADCIDRAVIHDIKTAADERKRRESVTYINGSLIRNIKTETVEPDMSESADGLQDSPIHNLKTDFRSISLQVSLSSDETSDKLNATNHSESDPALPEKSDELLEQVEEISLVKDLDDVFVPESSHLLNVLSPSSAAKTHEHLEQAKDKKQLAVSVNSSPFEASLVQSLRDISLQVSLSSDGFNGTCADDLEMVEDYERVDPDRKECISSPRGPCPRQKPSVHRLPQNSAYMKRLFDLSDEEQLSMCLPDDGDDIAVRLDQRLSEVPDKFLCSTLVGRQSSLPRAAGTWILSPVGTEDSLPDHLKLSASRRMTDEEESTSDSYMSANRASVTVPDTSESDDDEDTAYKTAYIDGAVADDVVECVADSPVSLTHSSRKKEDDANQVISISDSLSSDDSDFEKFIERTRTTKNRRRSSARPLKVFVVDDSEEEEEVEEEDEACDVTSDDDDDARIFYYQADNQREEDNVDALSNRLSRALNFSLTSSSSDDDFENVPPKRKHVTEKSDKLTSPPKPDTAAASVEKEAAIFRTPAPVVTKKRILSNITPKTTSSFLLFDKRQAPYTTGHLPPPRSSFLKSLSADVKDLLRDEKAAKYVKNFKSLRNELTAKLFTLFNREVFDMKIPSDMNVVWNNQLRRTAGFCRSRLTRDDPPKRMAQIELSVKVCDSADRLRDTLIHEMCHAIVWIEHGSREVHGSIWKFWARKANLLLPDLPPITRCHSYDINTKYIYKCVKCGYEIGRHSKSLDTEKKICGHCRGHFELLVRARTGDRTESRTLTPRTPNKFALFVKENYGDIKRGQPGFTHKEIMEMIGVRYSAKKAMPGDDRRRVELID